MSKQWRPVNPCEEILTDPASYAARFRTAKNYKMAALIELHTGQKRSWDENGRTLTVPCYWELDQDRRCWAGYKEDWCKLDPTDNLLRDNLEQWFRDRHKNKATKRREYTDKQIAELRAKYERMS